MDPVGLRTCNASPDPWPIGDRQIGRCREAFAVFCKHFVGLRVGDQTVHGSVPESCCSFPILSLISSERCGLESSSPDNRIEIRWLVVATWVI